MALPLSINGLTPPADFPASQFEALCKNLGGAYEGRRGYDLVFEALNAVAYRFVALAEYDQSFAASFNPHRDGQPFRYQQERDLFGFFTNAFSVGLLLRSFRDWCANRFSAFSAQNCAG
jgi:hypothetical protein